MKLDLVVLLLRFVAGFILGGILLLVLSLAWGLPLKISGPIPFIAGLLAITWGDKSIFAFMKLLGNFPT